LPSTAVPEASKAVPEASTAVPEVSTAVPEVSTAVPEVSTAVPEVSTAVPEVARVEEPSPTERPARRQAGDTAPEFLLRTPTSVTRVVDDFLDGVIRRVEGDR
jgi:hypothetical protein